jgi:extracellular matrix regulatory protein A
MQQRLVNIGFGNVVVASRIVAVIMPGSAPMKRLKEEARQQGKLLDATQGRKTRAVIITDSDHVILSAVQPATVSQRLVSEDESGSSSRADKGIS